MLSVSKHPKRRARTTEASFEKRIAQALKDQSVWSRHMADRSSGLPDRYYGGGRWIEFKSLDKPKVELFEGMSDAQRREAAALVAGGDRVFWMCLCHHKDGGKHVEMAVWGRRTGVSFDYPSEIDAMVNWLKVSEWQ